LAVRHRFDESFIGMGWRRAAELNLPTHSLALAAQQVLCTAPLLVSFSLAKRHVASENIGDVLTRYLALSPAASNDVRPLFDNSLTVTSGDRILGLIFALFFSTAIAATQQRWFELVWSQPRAPIVNSTFRQLCWVAGLCGYLIVVVYAGRAGHGVGRHVHAGRGAGPVVQFAVSFVFFWWSQHVLLSGRIPWRRLIFGAAAMAMGMTILVGLSGFALSGQIVSEVHDYGPIGATFVLSLWLVALSGLVCAGALIGQLIAQRRANQSVAHPDRN